MAFTEGSNEGSTNSTTLVEVVAAPGASTRRLVKTITVYNRDTAAATVTLSLDDNTTEFTFWKGTLAVGDTLVWNDPLVLDSTTDSINIVLAGAVTTNQLYFTAHYGDSS
jgi:hypothetical protein